MTYYRDVTISQECRDHLAFLEQALVLLDVATYDQKLALREVIERWDANDATEAQRDAYIRRLDGQEAA